MPAKSGAQVPLFGHEEPAFDAALRALSRTDLADGAWLDRLPGWVSGDAALFDRLAAVVPWHEAERVMYDRTVAVPRLMGTVDVDAPGLAAIRAMRAALDARYGTTFDRVTASLYRDGADGVAWHGDTVGRRLPNALVATVSLGAPRRLLLRRTGGGPSIGFSLGGGDLLVMGGTCQRTWQHSIPKVARAAPRIVVMFRPNWE